MLKAILARKKQMKQEIILKIKIILDTLKIILFVSNAIKLVIIEQYARRFKLACFAFRSSMILTTAHRKKYVTDALNLVTLLPTAPLSKVIISAQSVRNIMMETVISLSAKLEILQRKNNIMKAFTEIAI